MAGEAMSPEPIAVVGMGCRLPGDSDTPDEFWQMLEEKRSGLCDPPKSRWNHEGFRADKTRPGSIKPKGGFFIGDDVWKFDPAFFGVVLDEAKMMDPQQRKLLECVYEAFESGGITFDDLSGSNTGCYIGNFTFDYFLHNHREYDNLRPYSHLGTGNTILSNRISYLFDLCGPSLTLDTACASSVYALHLACRALQSGEIDGAIAGAANLMLAPEIQMSEDGLGALSKTSTCHTFDAAADGYGRAEGIGAVYLKRLSDAIRDRDPIRGVIRGTAANANGNNTGITHPSTRGQEIVTRAAYRFAGLDPRDTSYFEAHGTGTPVGDPIEIDGIGNFFIDEADKEELLVGSVKTNVGHGEAVSGMASIIKVCLALEKKKIPATIGIQNFNPAINFRGGRIKVVQDTTEWPSGYEVCRASMNSFGYGGANSHAIFEAASSIIPGQLTHVRCGQRREKQNKAARSEYLLIFSATDVATLKLQIENYRNVAEDCEISDLAYTLSCRRSLFFNCAYAVVREDDVEEDLEEHEITFAKRGKGANIAFIFTGQGAQSPQMGKELMLAFPSYMDTIRRLDQALQSLGEDSPEWTIEDVLMAPASTSKVSDPELSQPICTAVQIALVELLRRWNVTPVACVGHSSGEIASSFAAGALTAEEAIISAFYRGVGVGGLKVFGTMLAVGVGPEEVQPYLRDGVRIACYNSPGSVTLSGDSEPAAAVKAALEADRVFVRELKTGGRAYHSHHMKEIGMGYENRLSNALSKFRAKNGNTPEATNGGVFFSSVTGKRADPGFKPDPSYWRANLESPVCFTQAVTSCIDSDLDINLFIEIGPHSALAGPLRQIRDGLGISAKDLDYAATLVRGQSSQTRLLDLAGTLTMKGYPIDLEKVNAEEAKVDDKIVVEPAYTIVDLPRYSWNYSHGEIRHISRPNEEYRLRKFRFHDLLGSQLPGTSLSQRQWRNMLDTKTFPWLEHHKLGNQPVLPATGYLAIATEAARQFFYGKKFATDGGAFRYWFPTISILSALNLPPAGTQIEVLTTMRWSTITASITSKSLATFTISSLENGVWTEHCVGTVTKKAVGDMIPRCDEELLQEPKSARTWYRGFRKVSLNYGPAFNGLSDIRVNPATQDAVAMTELLPEGVYAEDSEYIVHPTAMDTCIQGALLAGHSGSLMGLKRSFVPTSMENVSLWSWDGDDIPRLTPGKGKALCHSEFFGLRAIEAWLQLWSPTGKPLFEIGNLTCTQYSEALDEIGNQDRHPYLRTVWKPDIDKLAYPLDSGSLLDLLAHKYPSLDICEVTAEGSLDRFNILDGNSSLCRYKSYTFMIEEESAIEPLASELGSLPGVTAKKVDLDSAEQTFDLIILSHLVDDDTGATLEKSKALLNTGGHILLYTPQDDSLIAGLGANDLEIIHEDSTSILVGTKSVEKGLSKDAIVVTRSALTPFDQEVLSNLLSGGRRVKWISLQDSDAPLHPEATYVFMVESQSSLFESLTEQELKVIQSITTSARDILWITHGDLLEGSDPWAGTVIGMARCLQTEHPTLTFKTMDLDHHDPKMVSSQIATILDTPCDDREFIVKNNTFYVSRLAQDTLLDEQFNARAEETTSALAPYDQKDCLRLDIDRVGIMDTLYWKDDEWTGPLKSGQVEVQVKSVGLNMKDFAVFQGTYNSETIGLEGAGIVRKVGPNVWNLKAGDRVCWAGLGKFRSVERYDARMIHKIQPNESFEEMASILIPFITAVYGLLHMAKLQKGETVLIHSATGGVGLAAIQIAKMVGAEVFATVGAPEKKAFLKETYGFDDDHIFSSEDASFATELMRMTNGRGVDVSLNSLVREQLRATWNCIGHHGRHVELGQTDILDQGILDMTPFKRGAAFMAMDLVLVFEQKPDKIYQVISEILEYYRSGKISLIPEPAVYPASEVGAAFEQFGKRERIGRVVVSMETPEIKLAHKKKTLKFKAEGAYLLVGCLGGVGRCLARHMVANGARHLIFLGRSGADKPEAALMIEYFEKNGVKVDVVKGSVTDMDDVQRAVSVADAPIVGVVQGVMALDDRLFQRHNLDSWNFAIAPKITGTWNLHNAVSGHPLDFFVMLGSSSSLGGFPTQSNYCAGNSFLEFFARYRAKMGLPASTISLSVVSEVGFVSQNERIEDGLERTGIHSINEAGLMDLLETAMMPPPEPSWNFDPLASNFLVTGVEPAQLKADIDLDSGIPFWREARIGPVRNAIIAKKSGGGAVKGARKGKLLLPDVLEMVAEKLAQTFNITVEDLDVTAPIAKFGMDSIIGTTLRTWCFKTLGADIAASEFMNLTLTTEILAQKVFDMINTK